MAVYNCHFTATAETLAIDLCELVAADDRPIKVIGFRLWQTSEVGDAQDEQLQVAWVRGNTTSGSGGSAAASGVGKLGTEPTSAFQFEAGNTTAASSGTAVTVYSSGWNVRAPMEVTLTEKQQFGTHQGLGLLVLRLSGAPVDSVTMGCSIDVEE